MNDSILIKIAFAGFDILGPRLGWVERELGETVGLLFGLFAIMLGAMWATLMFMIYIVAGGVLLIPYWLYALIRSVFRHRAAKRATAVLLVSMLVLVGCSGGGPAVVPTANVSVADGSDILLPPIIWRIRSPAELKREYAEATGGQRLEPMDSLQGFSATGDDGTIYVYTLAPKRVDDEATLTLGHEVMHTVLGDYHPGYRR